MSEATPDITPEVAPEVAPDAASEGTARANPRARPAWRANEPVQGTLLEDLTAFATKFPAATVGDFYDRFGRPIADWGACGSYKTYTNMVFLRGGQFVEVRHRDFGDEQYIALREVEPMEQIKVSVTYVAAHPPGEGETDEDTYLVKTPRVPNASAVLDALRR